MAELTPKQKMSNLIKRLKELEESHGYYKLKSEEYATRVHKVQREIADLALTFKE